MRSPEKFYRDIPHEERSNLEKISKAFWWSSPIGNKPHLYLVGGAIQKPWPRKDLDVVVIFDKEPVEIVESMTEYRIALAHINFISDVIDKALFLKFGWGKSIQLPYIDNNFGDEAILANEGTVIVHPPKGANIEFMNRYGQTSTRFEKNPNNTARIKL